MHQAAASRARRDLPRKALIQRGSWRRAWVIWIPVLLSTLAPASLAAGSPAPASLAAGSPAPAKLAAEKPAATDPAFAYPADWKLRGLDGGLVQLRQWKGRIIHLTKWSTRCGPCVADLPPIEALQDSLESQGVVFLLVSFEQQAPLRRFIGETSLRVPVYRGAEPEPDPLRSKTTPATFVIDRMGTVVFHAEGPQGWAGNRDMIAYLRSLLQPPAVPN